MHRVVRVIGRTDLARVSSPLDSRGWLTIVLFGSRAIERWPALLLAATEKRDRPVVEVAHQAREALLRVSDHFRLSGKLVTAGEDLAALEILVDLSTDWWARQSGALFVQADRALTKFRAIQRESA